MNQGKKIVMLVIILLLLVVAAFFILQKGRAGKKEDLTKNNTTTMETKETPVEKKDETKKDTAETKNAGEGAEEGESSEIISDGTLLKIEGESAILVKSGENEEELRFNLNSETKVNLLELIVKNKETLETELKSKKSIQLSELKSGDAVSVVSTKVADKENTYLAKEIRKIVLVSAD